MQRLMQRTQQYATFTATRFGGKRVYILFNAQLTRGAFSCGSCGGSSTTWWCAVLLFFHHILQSLRREVDGQFAYAIYQKVAST